MRLVSPILLLAALLAGCDTPIDAPAPVVSRGTVRMTIDGVTLFVPIVWARRRPNDPRPWTNAVQVGSGGWGQFIPWKGPIELADPNTPYVARSAGQRVRSDRPDPFFFLVITFEFPLPPPATDWFGRPAPVTVYPFGIDTLRLAYDPPARDIGPRYLALLRNVRSGDGQDIGGGWRELHRMVDGRAMVLRFDADDWRARPGRVPRRLAASFVPAFWSHHVRLPQVGWTVSFETQDLPVAAWRARHDTAEALFDWLTTKPALRDPKRRFPWWTDPKYRPTR